MEIVNHLPRTKQETYKTNNSSRQMETKYSKSVYTMQMKISVTKCSQIKKIIAPGCTHHHIFNTIPYELLVIGHVPSCPTKPRKLPAVTFNEKKKKKHQSKQLGITNTNLNEATSIPISIRGVKVRRRIWPPEAICHVRIIAPRTILFHSWNIGPLGQNLKKKKKTHPNC